MINKYESFLQTPISDPVAFSLALIRAARELRCIETGVSEGELVFHGDFGAVAELNHSSLRRVQSAFKSSHQFDIPSHLEKVVENWEKKGTATLMRGTRLPDPGGSFDFKGVHVTPQINIASGYAGGTVNASTGIGRLLNSREIGFVNVYEVPLIEKTYKNFEFEDSLKDSSKASKTTLHDLVDSMKNLSKLDSSEFYIDDDDQASKAMRQWQGVADNKHHYEMILDDDQKPSATYLRHQGGLLKVDLENPKWGIILARVQEALLRDFYEIKPLESALQSLKSIKLSFDGDIGKEKVIAQVAALIEDEKETRMHAPWEAFSLEDVALSGSAYLEKRPYISQSTRVGSAMDGSLVVKPESIEKFEKIVTCLRFNEFADAQRLIDEVSRHVSPISFGTSQDQIDSDLAKLIWENSQCMSAAIGQDYLSVDDAKEVVRDDLAALDLIKGDEQRFYAVEAIGRNAASQINYRNELVRLNKELASLAANTLAQFQHADLVQDGNFSGMVMDVSGGLVTQRVNRDGGTVKHDLSALSVLVVKGSVVDIKYAGGVGVVSGPGVGLGVGR